MNEKINKILEELYQMDPSLKKHESKIKVLLDGMLANKPNDEIDSAFVARLQSELLSEMSVSQKENVKAYAQNKFAGLKHLFYGFASMAAVIVLVFVGMKFWSPVISDPGGEFAINETNDLAFAEKEDDWVFEYTNDYEDLRAGGGSFGSGTMMKNAAPNMAMMETSAVMDDSLGFSVGGAKDVGNFRKNIENDYLPLVSDITTEGLYYDYYFDTAETEECSELFCPSYSYAVSKDPISGKDDYYLAVGLNSNLKESDFQRKKLNLVVVLDISGSMGSSFDEYYYDTAGNYILREGFVEEDRSKSKMEIANESIVALMDHLNPDDRFGVVLFDDSAYLAKELNFVGETDMDAIKDHILEIRENGGTDMELGMELGTELFDELKDVDPEEYENRIIFLTDAMPNTGDISEDGLMGQMATNANDAIHSSFIGIGLDFNSELIESISKVRGANYYSVHSSVDFTKRMDEEFEFMVTPLVFDLELKLDAEGFEIEKVYGSPQADEATGEIMKVNTLFPSSTEGGETKGGIVLLKLKKTSDNGVLKLSTSYSNRSGELGGQTVDVIFGNNKSDYYENNGIRKSILLGRYSDLMQNWLIYERANARLINDDIILYDYLPEMKIMSEEIGIICPPIEIYPILGPWERQSMDLTVDESQKEIIKKFKTYFELEMAEINDEILNQELEILNKLSEFEGGVIPMLDDNDSDWLLE